MDYRILIAEDDKEVSTTLTKLLGGDYHVTVATDSKSALKCLAKDDYAAALVELKLPGNGGMDIIREGAKKSPDTVMTVLTTEASVESAVEAMREGAFNYLSKPFSHDDMLANLKKAVDHHRFRRERTGVKGFQEATYDTGNIIGKSSSIQDIFSLVGKVADSDSNILILGESGTGKELIAKTIHYNSLRREGPFIPVNCGAIPAELLESEIFGHEKGAFTGAIASRPGRFERADGGTIFLDEIGELAFPLQVKLLRVLQEREFERVGGNKTLEVDVRVIAATNQNLEEAVREKRFREDLYYRLNVIPVHVPPLRERRDDIPLLAEHFLNQLAYRKNRKIEGFSDEAMEILKSYSWPGNIRELENIVERVVILKHGDGAIDPEDIPEKLKHGGEGGVIDLDIPDQGVELSKILEDLERAFIEKAMKKAGGVKSKAAELLGINRTTLIEKMKKKGMGAKESKVPKPKKASSKPK